MTRKQTSTTTSPIVVGVVDDLRSDGAATVGWDLADRLDVRIGFVHGAGSGNSGTRTALPEASDVGARLGRHLDEVLGERAGLGRPSGHLQLRPGKGAQALADATREMDAGLLVLGGHRRRGLFDVGSTASAALGHVQCAIWSQPCPAKPISNVLVPVDLSEDSLAALDTAVRLARLWGASVTVLSVFVPPAFAYAKDDENAPHYVIDKERDDLREELRQAMEAVEWGDTQHGSVFVEGQPVEEILAVHSETDLIVMATHGRSPLSDAFLGGVTRQVLQGSDTPVLAVRHPSRVRTD